MSIAPMGVQVDNAVAGWLVDPAPARIWVLSEIVHRQHSLATKWGGIGHYYSCRLAEGDTASITVVVPPGVTEMDLGFLVVGYGKVTVTSAANDTTGTQLQWFGSNQLKGAGDAVMITTGGDIPGGAANTHRAVTVAGSVSWTAQTDVLTIAVDSGGDCFIWGIRTMPIHVPR